MLTIMAGDGEQLDSLSLESYEIDDESFNSEDSNKEVDVEDSSNNFKAQYSHICLSLKWMVICQKVGVILNQRMKQDYSKM